MIPKRMFSIWLNEKEELPPLIKKCTDSQRKIAEENGWAWMENVWRESWSDGSKWKWTLIWEV